MSVVNRMLQDIDRRSLGAAPTATGLFSGLQSVAPGGAAPHPKPRAGLVWVGLLVTCIAAVVTTGWVLNRQDETPVSYRAPVQVPVAPPLVARAADVPAQLPPAVAPAPAPVEPAVQEKPADVAPVAHEKPTPAPSRAAALESFRMSLKLSEPSNPQIAVAVRPASLISTTITPAMTAPASVKGPAPLRQVAEEETVATARALWNGGANADALATLRQALATAESARNTHGVRTLVREMVRFEVTANRPTEALELLRRHEPVLIDDAESWAMRGNAEQRLGLHAEAAQSYLAAQRLAPNEGKWMLGAAISLAALGKTADAQGWVDRARERGTITPTIAAYLEELGIAPRR